VLHTAGKRKLRERKSRVLMYNIDYLTDVLSFVIFNHAHA